MTSVPQLERPPHRRRLPVLTDRGLATLFLVGLAVVALWSTSAGTVPADLRLLPCPIDAVTGVECPGCGMSRACVALARGEWVSAWRFHPFAFLLVPLALGFALWPDGVRRRWGRLPRVARVAATIAVIVACLAQWVWG